VFDVDVLGVVALVLFLGLLLTVLLVAVWVVGLLVDRAGRRDAPPHAASSVSERLTRLDELLVHEEITVDEHAQARMRILTEG